MRKLHVSDLLHITIGVIAYSIGVMVQSIEMGLLFAVVIGFLKELNDVFWIVKFFRTSKKRKFDILDLFITIFIPLILYAIHTA